MGMNQTQRKYLQKRITEIRIEKINDVRTELPVHPKVNILENINNGTLEVDPHSVKEAVLVQIEKMKKQYEYTSNAVYNPQTVMLRLAEIFPSLAQSQAKQIEADEEFNTIFKQKSKEITKEATLATDQAILGESYDEALKLLERLMAM